MSINSINNQIYTPNYAQPTNNVGVQHRQYNSVTIYGDDVDIDAVHKSQRESSNKAFKWILGILGLLIPAALLSSALKKRYITLPF